MNRGPAFQFYPDKWIAGTYHLSARAYQAYHKALCWMWLHSDAGFRITNDNRSICSATGLTKRAYTTVWLAEVMVPDNPLFAIEGNYLVSNGLRKEAEKQGRRREQAKAAADARWEQCGEHADALRTQCTPTPTLATLKPEVARESSSTKETAPFTVSDDLQQLAFRIYGMVPTANVAEWLTIHDEKRVRQAMLETERRDVKNASYTNRILQRWVAEGYPTNEQQKGQAPRQLRGGPGAGESDDQRERREAHERRSIPADADAD